MHQLEMKIALDRDLIGDGSNKAIFYSIHQCLETRAQGVIASYFIAGGRLTPPYDPDQYI